MLTNFQMFRKSIKQICQEHNVRPREAGEILRRRLEKAGVDPMETYLKEKVIHWRLIPNSIHRLVCQTGNIKLLKLYSKIMKEEIGERKKHKPTYFKTFDNFVEWLCGVWNVQFSKADELLRKKLKELDVDPLAIVCYINWIGDNNLTQKQIAKNLGIDDEFRVINYLRELQEIWPTLFILGPKPKGEYWPLFFENQKGRFFPCDYKLAVVREF